MDRTPTATGCLQTYSNTAEGPSPAGFQTITQMTAQIGNLLVYRCEPFDIAESTGERNLFNPQDHGLPVGWADTACWDGFHYTLGIVKTTLVVRDLSIARSEDPLPVFHGVAPQLDGNYGAYRDLEFPLNYSGYLLIGADYLGNGGFGGYPFAYEYRRVFELGFENGQLIYEADVSRSMAALRRGNPEDLRYSDKAGYRLLARQCLRDLKGNYWRLTD